MVYLIMLHMINQQTLKTLIFSSLIAANIVIWYEIFGPAFFVVLGVAMIIGVIMLWKK